MIEIVKTNYTQHSPWHGCDRNYTEYNVVINGKKSYFHRIDKDAKPYETFSRHEMAVRLRFFHKTGCKYVNCNIPSQWEQDSTLEEKFSFIRKNGYTPDLDMTEIYWSDELNAWSFFGNLTEYSYAWYFYIYDKSVVDYILEQIKTLPKEWRKINQKL